MIIETRNNLNGVTEMKILHIITQNRQPYGSRRRCCERCGKSIYALAEDDRYVETPEEYLRDFAEGNGLTRCCDYNPTAVVCELHPEHGPMQYMGRGYSRDFGCDVDLWDCLLCSFSKRKPVG